MKGGEKVVGSRRHDGGGGRKAGTHFHVVSVDSEAIQPELPEVPSGFFPKSAVMSMRCVASVRPWDQIRSPKRTEMLSEVPWFKPSAFIFRHASTMAFRSCIPNAMSASVE